MSYNLVLDRNCPKTDWKIGQFPNAFPLFVTKIATYGAGNKVEFTISAKSAQPPVLYVRTYSNTMDSRLQKSENDANTESPKFMTLTHDEEKSEKVEKSPKFEQFIYTYTTSENEIVDLVCLAAETGRIELSSFAIHIIAA